MGTRIVTCSCKQSFQDERYGKNKRVANLMPEKGKKSNELSARCTGCETVHNPS